MKFYCVLSVPRLLTERNNTQSVKKKLLTMTLFGGGIGGCPDLFQFANDFGILRKEVVASTIDARHIVQATDEQCTCQTITTKLQVCESITKNCQKGVTTTLVNPLNDSQFCFPAGSTIHNVILVDRTCGNLSCDLAFILGFLSDCVEDDTRQAMLAQRSAPANAQVTGPLLNSFSKLTIVERLTAARLAALKAIFDPEDIEQGECVEDLDLAIVAGDNFVSEPKPLMPAITVTSGELCPTDIDFYYCWTPPCPGVVVKPMVVMEPCPSRCTRGSFDACDPVSRLNFSEKAFKRGCH